MTLFYRNLFKILNITENSTQYLLLLNLPQKTRCQDKLENLKTQAVFIPKHIV